MYSFSYLEPVCCSMSSSNCYFLICIQISQEAGKMVWYSHLLKNSPLFVVIHTVKGFGVVNKAEVFLELLAFLMIQWMLAIWSLVPLPLLNPVYIIWKFSVHTLLKCSLMDFEHHFASMWNEWNCAVVWAFFGIAFIWDWNENWPFPVLWPLLSFPNLLAYWV